MSSEDKLVNRESKNYPRIISIPALQGIAIAFATLSIILTTTRLVYNWRLSGRFHLDNVFCGIAAFLLIPYTTGTLMDDEVQYNIQKYELGQSSHMPSLKSIQNAFKMEVACTVFFWLIIYTAKATFLAVYWRALCGRQIVRNAWFALVGVTALFFGIIFFSTFWVCGTPSGVGNLDACKSMETAAAIRLLTLWCTLNLVDLAVLIAFPFAFVLSSRTQFTTRQVVIVSAMLILALFFTALDILRTYWNLTISLGETTNLIFVWRVLEPNVAVVLAALSSFANLHRMQRPPSNLPHEDRDWIEIGDLGKDSAS